MATTTDVTNRLDRSLHVLLAEVEDLPRVASEWHERPEWEQVSFSLDWDHLMASYLIELQEAHLSGDMSDSQGEQYRGLLRELKSAMPLIARLQLYPPTIDLDA